MEQPLTPPEHPKASDDASADAGNAGNRPGAAEKFKGAVAEGFAF
jgi:hypothetical protein